MACLFLIGALSGCGTYHLASCQTLRGDREARKSVFVFLDGTANDALSGTNVWRLYDLVSKSDDGQLAAIYIAGVGTVDHPLLGLALGRGMEERILRGYEFIAQFHNPGDQIYIFGFSRGAHEARALAGLVAYAGIPRFVDEAHDEIDPDALDTILELTKKYVDSDKECRKHWKEWKPGDSPLLAKDDKGIPPGVTLDSAEVAFLGLWDTVPGSQLKDYECCKERRGFLKRYFWWLLPGVDRGERYKSDSYPPIRRIAHAVSRDEKRSKFSPLLVCPPMNPNLTKVTEVVFPGAHADVGGGYASTPCTGDLGLPGVSFNWMLDVLGESYEHNLKRVFEDPLGVAHWSYGDSPANLGSDCEDRGLDGIHEHPSVGERKAAGLVRVLKDNELQYLKYPFDCSDCDCD